MAMKTRWSFAWFLIVLPAAVVASNAIAADAPVTSTRGDRMRTDYFRAETAKLAEHCLKDIKRLAEWQGHRGRYREQLMEMLGLWPLPTRTDLKPVVTGKLEHEAFT